MDVSPGDSQTQLKQLEQSVCSAIVLHVDCLLQHSLQTSFSRQAGSRIELGGEGEGFSHHKDLNLPGAVVRSVR